MAILFSASITSGATRPRHKPIVPRRSRRHQKHHYSRPVATQSQVPRGTQTHQHSPRRPFLKTSSPRTPRRLRIEPAHGQSQAILPRGIRPFLGAFRHCDGRRTHREHRTTPQPMATARRDGKSHRAFRSSANLRIFRQEPNGRQDHHQLLSRGRQEDRSLHQVI